MVGRRTFLQVAGVTVVGGAPVFLAACGANNSDQTTTASSSTAAADIAILNNAIDLEHTAVAAYAAGAMALKGEVRTLALQFRAQEQEHADGLSQAVTQLGGSPNKALTSYSFPSIKAQAQALTFASRVENMAIAAYIDAIGKLSSTILRGVVASIVTNEAEHLAVLQGALGKPEAPSAFVTGQGK